ncbi:hypothetical protein [Novibacillus thermophilus]|nr:hypothetical protein [Novibacillus thermophilus]
MNYRSHMCEQSFTPHIGQKPCQINVYDVLAGRPYSHSLSIQSTSGKWEIRSKACFFDGNHPVAPCPRTKVSLYRGVSGGKQRRVNGLNGKEMVKSLIPHTTSFAGASVAKKIFFQRAGEGTGKVACPAQKDWNLVGDIWGWRQMFPMGESVSVFAFQPLRASVG